MKLTQKLLSFILLFKAQQKLFLCLQIYESDMRSGAPLSWYENLHDWFTRFSNTDLKRLGLEKNEQTFIALESFQVPDEWKTTEPDDLDQFTFHA